MPAIVPVTTLNHRLPPVKSTRPSGNRMATLAKALALVRSMLNASHAFISRTSPVAWRRKTPGIADVMLPSCLAPTFAMVVSSYCLNQSRGETRGVGTVRQCRPRRRFGLHTSLHSIDGPSSPARPGRHTHERSRPGLAHGPTAESAQPRIAGQRPDEAAGAG